MINKPLIAGVIGFLLGGLLVSIAATTFDKSDSASRSMTYSMSDMTMEDMTANLRNKTGDAFDKAFIADMIVHHQGAVAMARLAATNAKHAEIKTLSEGIITAQEKEIASMKQWQADWGYAPADAMSGMSHTNQ